MKHAEKRLRAGALAVGILSTGGFVSAQEKSSAFRGPDPNEFITRRAHGPVSLKVHNVLVDAGSILKETVLFRPSASADYASWQLSVLNSSNELVQSFRSDGKLPPRIPWLGIARNGRIIPDGFYRARLSLRLGRGETLESDEISFSFMAAPEIISFKKQSLLLIEDEKNIIVRIPDLIFQPGSARLSAESGDALRAVARFLDTNPDHPVYVLGYSDSSGSPQANGRLSEERAASVYAFLTGQRIAPERLRYKGMGESNPIAGNDTAQGRSQNRRVDIVMSKIKTVLAAGNPI